MLHLSVDRAEVRNWNAVGRTSVVHYCLRHMEEPSTGQCRECHGGYCARCLVYSFGPKKPPFCVGCALHASGVRNGARRTVDLNDAPTDMGAFDAAPPLFSDATRPMDQGPPAAPRGPSTDVKSSWSKRRAERAAAKSTSRSSKQHKPAANDEAAPPASGGPISAENLDPVLSSAQRRTLGQLASSSLTRS